MTRTRPLFLVTHQLRQPAVEVLAPAVDVVHALPEDQRALLASPDEDGARARLMRERVLELLPAASALHSIGRVDAELLDLGSRLRVVVVPGSGYDNVDVAAATARGIPVVHAAGSAYEPVAEHAIGLMLSLTKWIAVTDRRAHRERRGQSNRAMLLGLAPMPSTLHGKTLGIIGFGFIGRSLAQKCRDAFAMRVLAHDPYFDEAEAARLGVELCPLDEVLATSDVVSVNSPLTPETHHLIGEEQLASMKPTALLVNTARGGLVDTDALTSALTAGTIAGAGLDVTEPEPLPEGHPLFSLDNVVLTPHVAGISDVFMAQNARNTSADALAVLRGERPRRMVDPSVWPAYLERLAALASDA
ncbi:hydroxyacid dehydrogenase [Nocardioides humi]|uniref:D-3-phosphoglycerate dehydrogenase n=1 Tax=Nocardioides humi TaxID=449461 RepID=A0ABN2AE48_9ACTN|nr:hydroxyacid dehydrogenase [Nocardioides humi]